MSNLIKTLNLKERAEEDIYFAKLDRELIEKLHREAAASSHPDGQKAGEAGTREDEEQPDEATNTQAG
jgi:hypothetical protein